MADLVNVGTAPNDPTADPLRTAFQKINANVRTKLIEDTTFHVATTGSDITGDGSSGAPWATLQHADAVLAVSYDMNGFTATVQIADGNYVGFLMSAPFGGGVIKWNGNASDHTLVNITENPNFAGSCVGVLQPCGAFALSIGNVNIKGPLSTDQFYIFATNGGILTVGFYDGGTVGFSNATNGDAFNAGGEQGGGQIIVVDNIVVDGTGGAAWDYFAKAEEGGMIFYNAATTFVNSPTFNTLVYAKQGGYINAYFEAVATFSGTVSARSFECDSFGRIDTNNAGLNFFPGDAGLIGPQGIYDNIVGPIQSLAIQKSGIPATGDLVAGQCGVFKDTLGGGVYLAYNDAGTVKKVALT